MIYRLEYDDIFAAAVQWLEDEKGIRLSGDMKMTVFLENDKEGKRMPFVELETLKQEDT